MLVGDDDDERIQWSVARRRQHGSDCSQQSWSPAVYGSCGDGCGCCGRRHLPQSWCTDGGDGVVSSWSCRTSSQPPAVWCQTGAAAVGVQHVAAADARHDWLVHWRPVHDGVRLLCSVHCDLLAAAATSRRRRHVNARWSPGVCVVRVPERRQRQRTSATQQRRPRLELDIGLSESHNQAGPPSFGSSPFRLWAKWDYRWPGLAPLLPFYSVCKI